MQSIRTKAGIDVSARTLTAVWRRGGEAQEREFANDGAGHRQLRKWLGREARVCVEATGVYHLQLALALRAAGVEVMVVNPRVAKDFSRAMSNRSKTDKVDARTLLEYVERMTFVAWEAPGEPVLELRELGRRLLELVRAGVAEKNRAHAKGASRISRIVMADVKAHVAHIETRIKHMEAAAVGVIEGDDDLREQFDILSRIRGVGRRSGDDPAADRTCSARSDDDGQTTGRVRRSGPAEL